MLIGTGVENVGRYVLQHHLVHISSLRFVSSGRVESA